MADLFDLVFREVEEAGDVDCELCDVGEVKDESGVSLDECAQEDVLALAAGRVLAAVLLGVHPLVCDSERLAGVLGVFGHRREPVGACDLEAVAVLAECLGGGAGVFLGAVGVVGEDAELVPAESVGGNAFPGRGCQLLAEPGEQRVSCRVPVGVVVDLEAVQVEQHERGLRLCRSRPGRRAAGGGCRAP